ncbi:MAG: hypothetical protein ACXWP6_01395 [Ktedonobacterales bacterium]
MPRRYYILWLIAMACTEIGSTLDVSWHFGHVFDEISPPHLTSFAGVCLMVGLFYWALVRERKHVVGLERTALRAGAVALAIGILDMPLDFLWHQLFGVDITTWSPTHLMLNFPSDVYNVCVIIALLASPAARGLGAWAIAFAVSFRNILTTHFALNQQEYGAVALASLQRTGHIPWYVEPQLLRLVGPHAAQLVTGGIPDWLYLVYFAFALGYALTFGATVLQGRGTRRTSSRPDVWPLPFGAATALALTFVVWRLAFRTLFLAVHQAYPVVAWYVVPMGVVVDLSLALGPRVVGYLLAERVAALRPYFGVIAAALAGVVAALALYGGIAFMSAAQQIVPATPLAALPFACLTCAFGTALGYTVAVRVRESVRLSPASAMVKVPAREFVAHGKSKDIAEPGEDAVYVPGAPVATGQMATLRLRVFEFIRPRR